MLFAFQGANANCVYESPPLQPLGMLEETFKVLNMNVYGQHVEGGDIVTPFNDSYCQKRLRQIGANIRSENPPYDIVGLQEWHPDTSVTCNGAVLKNRIDDRFAEQPVDGYYAAPSGFEWSNFHWGHPYADNQKDGGLGIISETPFLWQVYDEDDYDDTVVNTENIQQFNPRFHGRIRARTAHGFAFSRIYLRYPDIAVDVYVVHVNSTGGLAGGKCNRLCKRGMLEQLREGIHSRSQNSGFPVLVMGDFNIGGPNLNICNGNPGYSDIMRNLGYPKDLWLEAHPDVDGVTVGWPIYTRSSGDFAPVSLISDPSKEARIDFMFVPHDPYLVSSRFEITLTRPDYLKLIKWTRPDGREWPNGYQPPVSDHYGIEATLAVRQRLGWAAVLAAIGL